MVKRKHHRIENRRKGKEASEISSKRREISFGAKSYSASGLKTSLPGTIFQLKLLMLFLKRGLRLGYEFQLATEMDDAEKFDDLVFKYLDRNKGTIVHRFLQAKRIENATRKITYSDLSNDNDEIFSLLKYFASFRAISNNPAFEGEHEDFIICTNVDIDEADFLSKKVGLKEISEPDELLDTRYNNKRYKIIVDHNHHLHQLLMSASEKHCLAQALFDCIKNGKKLTLHNNIFSQYHSALGKYVIDLKTKKFKTTFLHGGTLPGSVKEFRNIMQEIFVKSKRFSADGKLDTLWLSLKKISLNMSDNFGKSSGHDQLPNDTVTNQEINAFLSKLTLAVLMPNEDALGVVIQNEIGDDELFNLIDSDFVADQMQRCILNWFKEKEGRFLTNSDGDEFFTMARQRVDALILIGPSTEYLLSLRNMDIEFSCNDQMRLDQFLEGKKQVCVVTSLGPTLLTEIKLTKSVSKRNEYTKNDSHIFIHLKTFSIIFDRALNAFKKSSCHLLVLLCSQDDEIESFIIDRLVEILKKESYKKLVFIANENCGLIQQVDEKFQDQSMRLNLRTQFTEFSSNTRNKILKEDVVLNGQEVVKLREVVGGELHLTADLNSLFSETFITWLIKNKTAIMIGSKPLLLRDMPASYSKMYEEIHRESFVKSILTLNGEKELVLLSDFVFEQYSDNVCNAVRSCEERGCIVRSSYYDDIKFFDVFKKLCSKYQKTIYWISAAYGRIILKYIYDPSFYLVRKYKQYSNNNILKRLIFQQPQLTNVIFYKVTFETIQRLFKLEQNEIDSLKNFPLKIFESEENVIQFIKENRSKKVFCFTLEFDGNQERLVRVQINNKIQSHLTTNIEENEMFNSDDELATIIIDDPGMGKSTILSKLSEEKLKSFWIFRINLIDCREILERHFSKNESNINKVIDFIWEASNSDQKDIFGKALLSYLLQTSNSNRIPILLLVDGFDEINEKNQTRVYDMLKLILDLSTNSEHRIWITSRRHRGLEDCFENVLITELEPFHKDQQIQFLLHFWKVKYRFSQEHNYPCSLSNSPNDCKFQLYSKVLLDKVSNVLKTNIHKFIGIPLQMRLLAEAFGNDVLLFDRSSLDNLKVSDIYRKYIDMKCEIFFKEKTNISSGLSHTFHGWIKTDVIVKRLRRLAFHLLFAEEYKTFLAPKSPFKLDYVLDELQIKELYHLGLVQPGHAEGHVNFEHKTVTEYFVADMILSICAKNKSSAQKEVIRFLLDTMWIKPEWKTIRFFQNSLLTDNDLMDNILLTSKRIILEQASQKYYVLSPLLVSSKEKYFNITLLLIKSLMDSEETLYKHLTVCEDTKCAMYWLALWSNEALVAHVLQIFENSPPKWNSLQHYLNIARKDIYSRVHLAAREGNLEMLKDLASCGENVNASDANGVTALHHASEKGQYNCVAYLINAEANVNARGVHQETPLHSAASSGNIDVVCLLLKHSAIVEALTSTGEAPLHRAAHLGHWSTVEILMHNGSHIEAEDLSGETPLCIASVSGHLKVVEILLDFGAELEGCGKCGMTPLLHAAAAGHYEIVQCLIEKGANVLACNAEDNCGLLHMACSPRTSKSIEIVFEALHNKNDLIKKLMFMKDKSNNTFLIYAAENPYIDLRKVLNYILKYPKFCRKLLVSGGGADVTVFSKIIERDDTELFKAFLEIIVHDRESIEVVFRPHDVSLLCLAASKRQLEVAEMIIETLKFDKELLKTVLVSKDATGSHPLLCASANGSAEVIKAIRAAAEKISENVLEETLLISDINGNIPLHVAANNYGEKALKTLLGRTKNRQDILAKQFLSVNRLGQLPLHVAVANEDAFEVLLTYIKENKKLLGKVLLAYDKEQRTVLHVAAKGKNYNSFDILLRVLQNNPDIITAVFTSLDKYGRAPIHIIGQTGYFGGVRTMLGIIRGNQIATNAVLCSNTQGRTCLHWAAVSGSSNVIRSFLNAYNGDHKALSAAKDLDGKTALHWAAQHTNFSAAEELLTVFETDHNGLLSFLLEKDLKGNTFLHSAVLRVVGLEIVHKNIELLIETFTESILSRTTAAIATEILHTKNLEFKRPYDIAAETKSSRLIAFFTNIMENSKQKTLQR